MKVCVIVVWYNPKKEMWANIEKYLSSVNKCIIIDNSKEDNHNLILTKSKKIHYIPNKENLGIAKALNQGCEIAKEKGFEWVLTMDQDSFFDNNEIKVYFRESEKVFNSNKEIVSFTPNYEGNFKDKKILTSCITSGNLFNLKIWEEGKRFNESYFIYWVDTEFCYNLLREGYKIYNVKKAKMQYNIFDKKVIKFKLGKRFYTIRKRDNPIIKYYFVRNGLDVLKKFPEYEKNKLFLLKVIIKFFFFEKQKIKKLRLSLKGYVDFKNGKFGMFKKQ